jgi:YbbR domain-containing protein
LPQGIKVDGYQPSAIPIRLEEIVERQVPVEPKLEGKPADGFEIYGVSPNKGSVMVRGPASRVNALQKVFTEGIWIAGHKESFIASNVAIDVPDTKVDDGRKVQPATTTVTVLGGASLVNSLKPQEVKIVLDNDLKPQLEVPDALKEKVTLKSVQTSKFITLK